MAERLKTAGKTIKRGAAATWKGTKATYRFVERHSADAGPITPADFKGHRARHERKLPRAVRIGRAVGATALAVAAAGAGWNYYQGMDKEAPIQGPPLEVTTVVPTGGPENPAASPEVRAGERKGIVQRAVNNGREVTILQVGCDVRVGDKNVRIENPVVVPPENPSEISVTDPNTWKSRVFSLNPVNTGGKVNYGVAEVNAGAVTGCDVYGGLEVVKVSQDGSSEVPSLKSANWRASVDRKC